MGSQRSLSRDVHLVGNTIVQRMPAGGTALQLFGATTANKFSAAYAIVTGPLYVAGALPSRCRLDLNMQLLRRKIEVP